MRFVAPILLIIASLALFFGIFFRKLPQLTLLDLDTMPARKEEKKKKEILKKRIVLKAADKKINWRRHFQPLYNGWKAIQHAFRTYIGRLQREILVEREKKKQDVSSDKRARVEQEVSYAINQARHAAEKGEWEEAERQYIAAVRMDTKHAEAYRGLADVYTAQGHMKEAKETYLFVLHLHPEDDGILMKLGEISEAEGRLEEAVDYYQQAVVINDHIPSRFAKIADILEGLGEHDAALEAIHQAVELEPQNPKYLDKLIEISILVGDRALAEQALQQLRMVNPDNQKIPVFQDNIKKMG